MGDGRTIIDRMLELSGATKTPAGSLMYTPAKVEAKKRYGPPDPYQDYAAKKAEKDFQASQWAEGASNPTDLVMRRAVAEQQEKLPKFFTQYASDPMLGPDVYGDIINNKASKYQYGAPPPGTAGDLYGDIVSGALNAQPNPMGGWDIFPNQYTDGKMTSKRLPLYRVMKDGTVREIKYEDKTYQGKSGLSGANPLPSALPGLSGMAFNAFQTLTGQEFIPGTSREYTNQELQNQKPLNETWMEGFGRGISKDWFQEYLEQLKNMTSRLVGGVPSPSADPKSYLTNQPGAQQWGTILSDMGNMFVQGAARGRVGLTAGSLGRNLSQAATGEQDTGQALGNTFTDYLFFSLAGNLQKGARDITAKFMSGIKPNPFVNNVLKKAVYGVTDQAIQLPVLTGVSFAQRANMAIHQDRDIGSFWDIAKEMWKYALVGFGMSLNTKLQAPMKTIENTNKWVAENRLWIDQAPENLETAIKEVRRVTLLPYEEAKTMVETVLAINKSAAEATGDPEVSVYKEGESLKVDAARKPLSIDENQAVFIDSFLEQNLTSDEKVGAVESGLLSEEGGAVTSKKTLPQLIEYIEGKTNTRVQSPEDIGPGLLTAMRTTAKAGESFPGAKEVSAVTDKAEPTPGEVYESKRGRREMARGILYTLIGQVGEGAAIQKFAEHFGLDPTGDVVTQFETTFKGSPKDAMTIFEQPQSFVTAVVGPKGQIIAFQLNKGAGKNKKDAWETYEFNNPDELQKANLGVIRSPEEFLKLDNVPPKIVSKLVGAPTMPFNQYAATQNAKGNYVVLESAPGSSPSVTVRNAPPAAGYNAGTSLVGRLPEDVQSTYKARIQGDESPDQRVENDIPVGDITNYTISEGFPQGGLLEYVLSDGSRGVAEFPTPMAARDFADTYIGQIKQELPSTQVTPGPSGPAIQGEIFPGEAKAEPKIPQGTLDQAAADFQSVIDAAASKVKTEGDLKILEGTIDDVIKNDPSLKDYGTKVYEDAINKIYPEQPSVTPDNQTKKSEEVKTEVKTEEVKPEETIPETKEVVVTANKPKGKVVKKKKDSEKGKSEEIKKEPEGKSEEKPKVTIKLKETTKPEGENEPPKEPSGKAVVKLKKSGPKYKKLLDEYEAKGKIVRGKKDPLKWTRGEDMSDAEFNNLSSAQEKYLDFELAKEVLGKEFTAKELESMGQDLATLFLFWYLTQDDKNPTLMAGFLPFLGRFKRLREKGLIGKEAIIRGTDAYAEVKTMLTAKAAEINIKNPGISGELVIKQIALHGGKYENLEKAIEGEATFIVSQGYDVAMKQTVGVGPTRFAFRLSPSPTDIAEHVRARILPRSIKELADLVGDAYEASLPVFLSYYRGIGLKDVYQKAVDKAAKAFEKSVIGVPKELRTEYRNAVVHVNNIISGEIIQLRGSKKQFTDKEYTDELERLKSKENVAKEVEECYKLPVDIEKFYNDLLLFRGWVNAVDKMLLEATSYNITGVAESDRGTAINSSKRVVEIVENFKETVRKSKAEVEKLKKLAKKYSKEGGEEGGESENTRKIGAQIAKIEHDLLVFKDNIKRIYQSAKGQQKQMDYVIRTAEKVDKILEETKEIWHTRVNGSFGGVSSHNLPYFVKFEGMVKNVTLEELKVTKKELEAKIRSAEEAYEDAEMNGADKMAEKAYRQLEFLEGKLSIVEGNIVKESGKVKEGVPPPFSSRENLKVMFRGKSMEEIWDVIDEFVKLHGGAYISRPSGRSFVEGITTQPVIIKITRNGVEEKVQISISKFDGGLPNRAQAVAGLIDWLISQITAGTTKTAYNEEFKDRLEKITELLKDEDPLYEDIESLEIIQQSADALNSVINLAQGTSRGNIVTELLKIKNGLSATVSLFSGTGGYSPWETYRAKTEGVVDDNAYSNRQIANHDMEGRSTTQFGGGEYKKVAGRILSDFQMLGLGSHPYAVYLSDRIRMLTAPQTSIDFLPKGAKAVGDMLAKWAIWKMFAMFNFASIAVNVLGSATEKLFLDENAVRGWGNLIKSIPPVAKIMAGRGLQFVAKGKWGEATQELLRYVGDKWVSEPFPDDPIAQKAYEDLVARQVMGDSAVNYLNTKIKTSSILWWSLRFAEEVNRRWTAMMAIKRWRNDVNDMPPAEASKYLAEVATMSVGLVDKWFIDVYAPILFNFGSKVTVDIAKWRQNDMGKMALMTMQPVLGLYASIFGYAWHGIAGKAYKFDSEGMPVERSIKNRLSNLGKLASASLFAGIFMGEDATLAGLLIDGLELVEGDKGKIHKQIKAILNQLAGDKKLPNGEKAADYLYRLVDEGLIGAMFNVHLGLDINPLTNVNIVLGSQIGIAIKDIVKAFNGDQTIVDALWGVLVPTGVKRLAKGLEETLTGRSVTGLPSTWGAGPYMQGDRISPWDAFVHSTMGQLSSENISMNRVLWKEQDFSTPRGTRVAIRNAFNMDGIKFTKPKAEITDYFSDEGNHKYDNIKSLKNIKDMLPERMENIYQYADNLYEEYKDIKGYIMNEWKSTVEKYPQIRDYIKEKVEALADKTATEKSASQKALKWENDIEKNIDKYIKTDCMAFALFVATKDLEPGFIIPQGTKEVKIDEGLKEVLEAFGVKYVGEKKGKGKKAVYTGSGPQKVSLNEIKDYPSRVIVNILGLLKDAPEEKAE